jgi:hypothetical protein
MKNKINQIQQLPKEFDLKKYDACEAFSFLDWLVNLELRALTQHMIRLDRTYKSHRGETRSRVRIFLREPIRKAGIPLQEGDGLHKNVMPEAVHDVPVYYYFSGAHELEMDRCSKYIESFKRFDAGGGHLQPGDMELMNRPVWAMYKEVGIDDSGDVMAIVNLDSTEDQAMEDFRNWYRKTKSALGMESRRKPISEQDKEQWSRNGVLAFADLQTWAMQEDVEITNQLYGLALFPEEFNVNLAERIRKGVEPLTKTLLSHEFLGSLRLQLLAEKKNAEVRG